MGESLPGVLGTICEGPGSGRNGYPVTKGGTMRLAIGSVASFLGTPEDYILLLRLHKTAVRAGSHSHLGMTYIVTPDNQEHKRCD